LPPTLFWRVWKKEKINGTELSKHKVKFSLLFDYQELSGNESPSEVPCFSFDELDGQQLEPEKVDGLITLKNNHRYKNHPRLFPAENKVSKEIRKFA
jgi:hypothetical protein